MKLFIDFETQSEAEMTVVGSWNYSRHPSTKVLCYAIRKDKEEVKIYEGDQCCPEWIEAVNAGAEIHAQNCFFEYGIVTNALPSWPQPHPECWRDTMAKALSAGFPASLEDAAKALRLNQQKGSSGTALINFFCKPISSGKRKGEFRKKEESPERWQQLLNYCRQDVVTEVAIDEALPDLSENELAFWLATWDMNRRGIYVDTNLVHALKHMAEVGRRNVLESLNGTGFDQTDISNHRKVLDYIKQMGVESDSVAKTQVKELLKSTIPDHARTVLEARQATGKTSLAKLDTLLAIVDSTGRVRNMTRYHGTTTGRDSSVGFNLQNLPRGEKMDFDALISAAQSGNEAAFLQAAVTKNGPDPLGGVVTCLRGCLAAPPGNTLHQCDWAAIEPRIGAWLVDDKTMLEDFRRIDNEGGVDIYQIEAARLFSCDPKDIKGDRRQYGKVYVLQNQYQSGEASIQQAAKDQYGLALTIGEALDCKNRWRSAHPLWVSAWYDLERGAMMAINNPQQVITVGKCAWCFNGSHLKLRLPSSRIVWFPWAEIHDEETKYGSVKPTITYEFVHPKTKQWVRGNTYGGALFNAVVQGTGACLMRYAACNLRRRGFDVVLRVHDEILVECPAQDAAAFATFKKTMLETPSWAPGLRINGAGWSKVRYGKE